MVWNMLNSDMEKIAYAKYLLTQNHAIDLSVYDVTIDLYKNGSFDVTFRKGGASIIVSVVMIPKDGKLVVHEFLARITLTST